MKKLLSIILSIMLLSCALIFTACDGVAESRPTDSMLFDLIEYNYGTEYQAYGGGYNGELPNSFEEMYDYMHIDLSETFAEWQNSEFNPDNMARRPSEKVVDFSKYNEAFFENKALLNFYYIYLYMFYN